MKKLSSLLLLLSFIIGAFSQAPEKMSYQAVVRDGGGALVQSHAVGIRIQILQASEFGAAVYNETHSLTTNVNGLVTLEIGSGTPVLGTFASIDWSNGPYFIKTETDPAGGTNYTAIVGTSQLLSVPYSLYAKTVSTYNETDPVFNVSEAKNITGTNTSNWNTAYSWGNHATVGYVPGDRNITINGTLFDLKANRSWDVGTVTSVGLTLPNIFSISGSPVTSTGTFTATLVSQSANRVFASPNASSGTPSFRALVSADIPNLDWSKIITGKPTTLAGYGITDAAPIASPTFTGTPRSTTATAGTNTTQIATTAFVSLELNSRVPIHYIGESYGGGKVFYVYDNGQHGLIATIMDPTLLIMWYSNAYITTMARSDGVGAGKANTTLIIAGQKYGDGTNYAARICNEFSITSEGVTYGDWYLPSAAELHLLFLQKDVIGGFLNGNQYWSSTETGTNWAYSLLLFNGGLLPVLKNTVLGVRPIRAF